MKDHKLLRTSPAYLHGDLVDILADEVEQEEVSHLGTTDPSLSPPPHLLAVREVRGTEQVGHLVTGQAATPGLG